MLKTSFRYRFEAAHRFLGSASKACTTPHGHTWYATLSLKFTGSSLNSNAMTADFALLKKPWRELLQNTFDHSYLHHWQDPLVEALKSCQPDARLVPFPEDPTTEMVAIFLFHKMDQIFRASPMKDLVSVESIKVEETETNHVECQRDFYLQEIERYKNFTGWWNSENTDDRSFSKK